MSKQIALNVDCMEYMKTVPDKYFDLAVVDPPYGGGAKLDDNRSQIGNVERERERAARRRSGLGIQATKQIRRVV